MTNCDNSYAKGDYAEVDPEKSMRVVRRAFLIMRVIGKSSRSMSVQEITNAVMLPYPTVRRLVLLLKQESMVSAEGSPGRYRLALPHIMDMYVGDD